MDDIIFDDRSVEATVASTIKAYLDKYGVKPSHVGVAPGRVNLIGEHTDYNNGFVMPMALPLVTVIAGARRTDDVCELTALRNVDGPTFVTFRLSERTSVKDNPRWAKYVKGVVFTFPELTTGKGFNAVIGGSVPLGGGLSSSASVEVATYTFLEALTGQQAADGWAKALACQKAEHEYANVPCGIMDQFAATFGEAGCALLLDCKTRHFQLVPLRDPNVLVLIANTNVKHSLDSGLYAQLRDSCYAVAAQLHKPSLREISLTELEANRSMLSDKLFKLSHHVVSENERTEKAAQLLSEGNYGAFGQLMYASHESLRDDYGVSCVELDALVDTARRVPGVFGARMTGAGFGGCTVTVCRRDCVDRLTEQLRADYTAKFNIEPTFFICSAFRGAYGYKLDNNN